MIKIFERRILSQRGIGNVSGFLSHKKSPCPGVKARVRSTPVNHFWIPSSQRLWRRCLLFPAFKLWTNLLCSGRQVIQPAPPRETKATEKPSLQRSETENRNWKAQVLISGALWRLVPLICCVFNNPGFNLNESDAPSPKIFYSSLWVTPPAQPPTHPSLTSLLWFGYGWSRQRSPWFLMSQCCWIVMWGLLRQICDLLSKLDRFLGELIHSGEFWSFWSRQCLIFNIALLLTSSAFSLLSWHAQSHGSPSSEATGVQGSSSQSFRTTAKINLLRLAYLRGKHLPSKQKSWVQSQAVKINFKKTK